MIYAVAAIGPNGELGLNNKLIYHFSEDMKRFKTLTWNRNIYMGYKTWESLPVEALPNRMNTVVLDMERGISKKLQTAMKNNDNLKVIDESMFLALLEIHSLSSDVIVIIGGGRLYAQTQYYWSRLYLTKFYEEKQADTFFPEVDYNNYTIKNFQKQEDCEFIDFYRIK